MNYLFLFFKPFYSSDSRLEDSPFSAWYVALCLQPPDWLTFCMFGRGQKSRRCQRGGANTWLGDVFPPLYDVTMGWFPELHRSRRRSSDPTLCSDPKPKNISEAKGGGVESEGAELRHSRIHDVLFPRQPDGQAAGKTGWRSCSTFERLATICKHTHALPSVN